MLLQRQGALQVLQLGARDRQVFHRLEDVGVVLGQEPLACGVHVLVQ